MSIKKLMDTNAPEKPLKLTPKQQAYAILRSQGLTNSQTSKMLNFTPQNGSLTDKKIDKKYDLTNQAFTRLASKVVKKILKGDPTIIRHQELDRNGNLVEIIKDQYPKHSDQLHAAGMVYDRYQPVNRGDDGPRSVSFINIVIDGYQG